MRFRSTNNVSPYMNRKFQLRMIMMIVSLGVVIFAIKVTSQPAFWAKIFPDDPAALRASRSDGAARNEVESQPGLEGIPQVQLDEVLIARAQAEEESENPEASAGAPEAETPDVESTLPLLPDLPQVADLEIDPVRFESIEDYSVAVRQAESDAFFYTLYHAGLVPLKTLTEAGETNISHAVLRADPEYYRGKVISIEGDLRGLKKIEADQNAYGIESFYEAWIITPTSNNIPYRVVAQFIDEGLPLEDLISETVPVRASGYFFKIQSYATLKEKPQMTPLLIARRITQAPARPASISLSKNSNPGRWLFIIFSVVFVIAIWSAYRATVGANRMRVQRKEMLESDGDLSELQGQASIDPGEELRKISEQE